MTGATMTVQANLGRKEMIQSPAILRVQRTFDYANVLTILRSPKVWGWFCDDYSSGPESVNITESNSIVYLACHIEGVESPVGIIYFIPWSSTTWEVYGAMLPPGMGRAAIDFAGMALRFMFTRSTAFKVIARCAEDNKKAIRFVRRCGGTPFAINRFGFVRGGKLIDEYLFEIYRSEVLR